jgi:hypothetical protein
MMRLAPVLVLLAACGAGGEAASPDARPPVADAATPDAGSPDAGSPDAGSPDAGPSFTVIDWHDTRGAPLAATTLTVPGGDVVATHAGGFVLGRDCAEGAGCTYEWRDLEGNAGRVRERLRPVNSSILSPDGGRLLLLELGAEGPCGAGEQRPVVAEGTLRLLDAATGAETWSRPLRTNVWSTPAFSTSGRWFGVGAIPDGACGAEEIPHAVDSLLPFPAPGVSLFAELPRDRFVGWRGHELGVASALDGSFVPLGVDVDVMGFGAGWFFSADGYGTSVEKITAFTLEGRLHSRTFDPEAAWRLRHAWGPWVVLCREVYTGSPETCVLVDVTGELPDRTLIIDPAARDAVAVLGKGESIAFLAPGGHLERFDVAAAHTERVGDGPGSLHRLGDGEALLWHAGGDVILVEAGRHERLVAGDVAEVIALPGPVGEGRPTRQSRTALIVQTFAVETHRLWLFDYPTRRLVRLSDRAYHAPHVGSPYAHDDCGTPRPMRSGGHPGDLLRQDARLAFFLEQPAGGENAHSIWVVPLDLSGPPRRLGEALPTYCRSPMASPDGALVLVEVEGIGDTTSVILARP